MDATLIDHAVAKVYRYHRHEVFDDAQAAPSQFHQDLLIPVGARNLGGCQAPGQTCAMPAFLAIRLGRGAR